MRAVCLSVFLSVCVWLNDIGSLRPSAPLAVATQIDKWIISASRARTVTPTDCPRAPPACRIALAVPLPSWAGPERERTDPIRTLAPQDRGGRETSPHEWRSVRGRPQVEACLDRQQLEASSVVLSRERWPAWGQLGVQNGANID